MRSQKTPDCPWNDWILDDQLSLLKDLHNHHSSPDYIYRKLQPFFQHMVLTTCFPWSAKLGSVPPSTPLKPIIDRFLSWLDDENFWTQTLQWQSHINESELSLTALLSKSFQRFWNLRGPRLQKEFSGLMYPESSINDNDLAGNITKAISEAFSYMLIQLPDDIRLIYSLHLEGLTTDEISFVVKESLSEVDKKIKIAKKTVRFGEEAS